MCYQFRLEDVRRIPDAILCELYVLKIWEEIV